MAQPVTQSKSRSVLGATELTLMAPIKRGLIPALDSRSYRSRAALVFATLQALGISRREIEPTPAITEVADTIRTIRSFRMAIVGELQPQVLLSVSFDGGWEPYIRRIWHPLGPLLDLVFCNCEGYLLSSTHGFPEYAGWVRQAQVETGFYYEDSPLTVSDLHLLEESKGQPSPAPTPQTGDMYVQARAAMVAFYRLTDMFPDQPGNEDGVVLRRAARLLLGELSDVIAKPPPAHFLRTATETAAWEWFIKDVREGFKAKPPEAVKFANVQGGILEPYPDVVQGRLMLVGLDDAAAVSTFLKYFEDSSKVSPASPQTKGPLFVNLAFTYAGLVLAGVDRGTLDQLPAEFREGMEARAGILGDWERNHPQHWTLPQRYKGAQPERVQLSTVHVLVQFWLADMKAAELERAVRDLEDKLKDQGVRVLAVEQMQRIINPRTGALEGHFGFVDSISQPGLVATSRLGTDTVAPGELLLGYSNDRNDNALEGRLWSESTFLVVRKLRQDVKAFMGLNLSDDEKASLMGRQPDGRKPVYVCDLKGTKQVGHTTGNDFNYADDNHGSLCPLHAHIRRANPRTPRKNELDPLPRIVRRGMSYGSPYAPASADEDRGLMFMAYNASIAEQFEMIQGWLAGRNSSGPGSYSGQRDPFLGVARAGDPRSFPWSGGQVDLSAAPPLVTLQWGLYAFVPSLLALRELRIWAGERAAEDKVNNLGAPTTTKDAEALQRKTDRRNRDEARQAAVGSALIVRLQQAEQALGFDSAVEQWKIALEDVGARVTGASQAIWTAVRKAHAGVLRTPYGVLVCSKLLVEQVFANGSGCYTVGGYNNRLRKSFGEIYLGRDDKKPGREEANPANDAIMAVTQQKAYELAYARTKSRLTACVSALGRDEDISIEVRDMVDAMLADVCSAWFGLPDGTHVAAGGWHWRPNDQATCPGHFHSPSRYTFQPQPGDEVQRVGELHGKVLKERVKDFVVAARSDPGINRGTLGSELFTAFTDDDRLASTLIGVMMGFLPTVDGNLRGVLYEWIVDRSLWDHQAALRPTAADPTLQEAFKTIRKPLDKAMQLRPVPEVVWRTALHDHKLGTEQVRVGDTVVVSIVSATQEDLLNDQRYPFIAFGGNRKGNAPPTHACPGYDMAIGVMLGFLAALMNTVSLRPSSSPMALRIGPR